MTPKQKAALQAHRDARDPLKQYQPGPTQKEFHDSYAYFRLITGGGRSGKTTSALADLAMCLRGIHPTRKWYGPIVALVFCVSRQQAAMVVQRKLFTACEFPGEIGKQPLIPKHEIEELGSVKVGIRVIYYAKLKNGSQVYFSWSDVDDVWKKVQGVKVDYIYIDENAGSETLLIECRKRLLDPQSDPMRKPWGGCLTWAATGTIVNAAFDDFKAKCQDAKFEDHAFFLIKPGENKAVSADAIERLAATMTDEQKRIHILGEESAGQQLLIYGVQWNDDRHMRKTDYEIQPSDNLWLAYDPGTDHPSGLLFAAINAANPIKLRVVKFFQRRRLTLEDEVQIIKDFLRGRTLEGLVYDVAAHRTEKTGLSVKNQLMQILYREKVQIVRGLIPGRNRHADGISRVRQYLNPDPQNPYVEPYVELNPSQESGGPLLRAQMLKYRSYEPGKYTGPKGVVKVDDEGPDCLRYLISVTPAYNPAVGCGYPQAPMPEAPPEPSADDLRYQNQLRASREMARGLRERDLGFNSIPLW